MLLLHSNGYYENSEPMQLHLENVKRMNNFILQKMRLLMIIIDGPNYPVCGFISLVDEEFSRGEGALFVECFTTLSSLYVTTQPSLVNTQLLCLIKVILFIFLPYNLMI